MTIRKNSSIANTIKYYNAEKLVKDIESHLKEYDGELVLRKSAFDEELECDGEFSEDEMRITCVIDSLSDYWIGVMIHEYCHFLQCISGKKCWLDFQDFAAQIDPEEVTFDGSKSGLSLKRRRKLVSTVLDLELDCDRMTLRVIKDKKINLSSYKEYVSKCNIIYYKYLYWAEYNFWPFLDSDSSCSEGYWGKFQTSRLLSRGQVRSIEKIPKPLFDIFERSRLMGNKARKLKRAKKLSSLRF